MAGKPKNILGMKFGRLIVQSYVPQKIRRAAMWKCICSCGNSLITEGNSLRLGRTRSCGCIQGEWVLSGAAHRIHGHSPHGSFSRTYLSWVSMKLRCCNRKNKDFRIYGAAGIKVCDRWQIFKNFLKDMGVRPTGKTIGRLMDLGNYEPGNCKWMTPKEHGAEKSKKNRMMKCQNSA
jgi:hypothetical protein